VDLTLNQAAALTSLTYNIGCPHFKGSTLLRDLNNGDIPGAQSEFAAWINSGGAVNPTLISRRVQEETLFAG
jgi:lysozyme